MGWKRLVEISLIGLACSFAADVIVSYHLAASADVVVHVFFEKSDGFLICFSFFIRGTYLAFVQGHVFWSFEVLLSYYCIFFQRALKVQGLKE